MITIREHANNKPTTVESREEEGEEKNATNGKRCEAVPPGNLPSNKTKDTSSGVMIVAASCKQIARVCVAHEKLAE